MFQLIDAYKVKDLPKLMQDIIGDNDVLYDKVQERYLDLDEKDRWNCLRSAMKTYIEHDMLYERAYYHILLLQEICGEEIDEGKVEIINEDCEENEIEYRHKGVQTEPIAIQTEEEPKQEVVVPVAPVVIPPEPPLRTNSRKYYNASGDHKCFVCQLGLASDGSLHNHFKSKLHAKCLNKKIELIRQAIQPRDKVIVEVRNNGSNPELSFWNIKDIDLNAYFGDIQKYITEQNKNNPITHIQLKREHVWEAKDGTKQSSWKIVQLT